MEESRKDAGEQPEFSSKSELEALGAEGEPAGNQVMEALGQARAAKLAELDQQIAEMSDSPFVSGIEAAKTDAANAFSVATESLRDAKLDTDGALANLDSRIEQAQALADKHPKDKFAKLGLSELTRARKYLLGAIKSGQQ
jgi:hypothetical protein